jgi:Flp pilus assembly protein TadG
MSTQSRFLRRLTEGFTAFARRLRRDERGAIAVQFALLALPLAVLVFGLVDISRVSLQRRQMQDALDAATLIAARSTATTDAQLDAVGDPAFAAEIAGLNLGLTVSSSTFTAGTDNHILGTATGTLTPIIANLWTKQNITITATSDVVRQSKNLEVAIVLDITGSMAGTRLADLKTGASDLIDIVVKDVQSPFYSKAAIVPYSVGVNVGSYADAVRGPVNAYTITGISKANNAVVTSNGHGLITGDKVTISGVNGMTTLNNNTYTVNSTTTNSFTLNVNTSSASNYSSGGTATCDTSTNSGCKNFTFNNASWGTTTLGLSNCVSERTGTNAYTDVAPSTTYLGRNYVSSGNKCPDATITPLSSDRTALKSAINDLEAAGSTAGQIGFAWGWYMISPNFGYLWPNASQKPAAYKAKDLMKVVVLMTDGDFNTPYCKGVIAADADSGSGSSSDHINCNATNGDPFAQTKKMCDEMKKSTYGLTIYTVGFTVTGTDAKDVLKYCATDSEKVYFPVTGSDLKASFKSIAQGISNLRIAK